jgi:hypothetical protein
MLAALSGCAGDEARDPAANAGGTTAGGGAGGAGGTGGGAGSAGSSAGGAAGGGGSGGVEPAEPFTVENGVCHPTSIPGPEPVYEVDSTFGHVGSMVARGDTLYFAESADFNDIPPRIAQLGDAGAPTTLIAGARAAKLQVFGEKLYYVEGEALKSFDLVAAGAAPVVLNTVADILAYDDQHVVYKDATNIYAVAVGAPDLTGAVTLGSAEPIASAVIGGDTLYLSNGDKVYRVGLDGTGAADVVPDDDFGLIGIIALDGTSLYFDDDDNLRVVPVSGGTARTIAVAGPDSLFYDTAAFASILPAGDVIYWADDGSTYGWTAVDGSRCGILGTHNGFFQSGGAVADGYIYASGEATIYRIERPE